MFFPFVSIETLRKDGGRVISNLINVTSIRNVIKKVRFYSLEGSRKERLRLFPECRGVIIYRQLEKMP